MVFPPTSRENNGGGFQIPEYDDGEDTTTVTPGGSGAGTTGGSSRAETVFIGDSRPSGTVDSWQPSVPVYTSKTQAEGMWLNLLPERRQEIDDLAKAIDPRRKGKALYFEAINAAALARQRGQDVTPATYINQLLLQYTQSPEMFGDGGTGTNGRRSGAYAGPTSSVTVQAESDIVAAAQATAQALLGRAATDEELQKVLSQTRKAEQAQPTVTTRQGLGQTTTEEGLTKEGRDAILKKVLMSSPDYASYQFDSTVMDMMLNNLREGQEVARGTF